MPAPGTLLFASKCETVNTSSGACFVMAETEDRFESGIQVRLEGKTVWLTQRLIADLYQVTVPTINEHLADIYAGGELSPEATVRKFRIVQIEGKRQVSRLVDHYSLEAILAVGYRVRSSRGTTFRQWATSRLSELLVKGFPWPLGALCSMRSVCAYCRIPSRCA